MEQQRSIGLAERHIALFVGNHEIYAHEPESVLAGLARGLLLILVVPLV